MQAILQMDAAEIQAVGGGVDHSVVSAGLGIMASSIEVGLICPPAGGAIATIGAIVAISGLFS